MNDIRGMDVFAPPENLVEEVLNMSVGQILATADDLVKVRWRRGTVSGEVHRDQRIRVTHLPWAIRGQRRIISDSLPYIASELTYLHEKVTGRAFPVSYGCLYAVQGCSHFVKVRAQQVHVDQASYLFKKAQSIAPSSRDIELVGPHIFMMIEMT